jgi:hypothetical protein
VGQACPPRYKTRSTSLELLCDNPLISAYKALNGPYDWGKYPLAPPRCKAIIYEAPTVQGTWASRGTNAWLLGPSNDHNQCNLFYVPEMWVYRISGSAELFPQHCQVPNLSPIEHLKALIAELAGETTMASRTTKGKALFKILCTHLDELVMPSPAPTEQRVPTALTTSPTLPLVLQRVSDSPPPSCKRGIQRQSGT